MFSWGRDDFDEKGKLILLYRHQRIIDETVIKKGDIIIDIGGWGKLEYRLYQEGCNVSSIDIDRKKCNELMTRYGTSFNIINGDAYMLPFKDKSFDTVTCFEVFEHIKPKKRLNIVREIYRTLKNHGHFVGTIPIPGYCHSKDDPTIDLLTPEEFDILISRYFNKICIEPTGSVKKEDIAVSWYFKAIKKDNIQLLEK